MIKSLSECLTLTIDKRGVTPKKLNSDWCSSGYRVLSANNVKTTGIEKTEEIRYIDEKTYKKWMREEIKRGDILLTSEAPAGEVYYWDSDEKIVAGQRLYVLRTKKEVNPLFLKYYLQSSKGQAEIRNKCSGSTVFGISAKTFNDIEIILPDDKITQDKIANTLRAIDKKIENNIAIIVELEAMAKTIYDYWFLQFEFPDENGNPYKSSGGKMVWNEELKRDIPEDWKLIPLGKLFSIIMGSSPKGDTLNETKDGIEFYQGSTDFEEFYPTERVYTTAPIRMAKAQDVLMSVRAPVGAMNIAMNDCCIGRGLAAINHKSTLFAWNTLKTFQKYFDIFNGNGTTFGALTSDDFKEQLTLEPEKSIVDKYCEIVNPFEQQIRTLAQENQELASLRDFLLPLLMNGQITFEESE